MEDLPKAGLTRDGSATYPIKSCKEKQCLAISIDVNTARLSWKDKSLTYKNKINNIKHISFSAYYFMLNLQNLKCKNKSTVCSTNTRLLEAIILLNKSTTCSTYACLSGAIILLKMFS